VFYEFHQESNFFYLTGFNEPEATAVIQKTGPSGEYIFHLFVRPKDVKAEQWDGARSGEQAALDVFNADEVSSHQVLIKNTY
jgi:intermediate cleaving peptidase 55